MPAYDQFVTKLERNEIDVRAYAWRTAFCSTDAWVIDLPRIIEFELPKVLPGFVVRVRTGEEMAGDMARTWHSVPAIDMSEDTYQRLCDGDAIARFTTAHELGHLFLHSGESRPRAVEAFQARTIPANRSSERQADHFAASFLMPESIVRQFPAPSELAIGCRVTPRAAELRMRELLIWPKARPSPPEVEAYLREFRPQNRR